MHHIHTFTLVDLIDVITKMDLQNIVEIFAKILLTQTQQANS